MYTYVCMHIRIYVYMYMCVCVWIYMRVYMCIYMYTYIYSRPQGSLRRSGAPPPARCFATSNEVNPSRIYPNFGLTDSAIYWFTPTCLQACEEEQCCAPDTLSVAVQCLAF